MKNSINQPDSDALIMITNGSLEILQLINKIMNAQQNKQQIPNIALEFDNIIKKIKEEFDRYVDLKINKIRMFMNYFISLRHDVKNEKEDLENFLKLWEPFKLKLYNFNVQNAISNHTSINEVKKFRKEILVEGKPIFESLKKIESRLEAQSKNIIQTAGVLDHTIDRGLLKILLE